jgi:cytochrome P450
METNFDATSLPVLLAGSAEDLVPTIAKLRESDPVCWIPGIDVWLVTRHEDVRLLLADPRLTSDPRAYAHYQTPSVPGAARWLTEMPFRSTPSDPMSLGRRLVAAALTPRAAERNEQRIREVVERFAAPLRGRTGIVDLIGEFTAPIATAVIARMLGVPPKEEDEGRFRFLARRTARGARPLLTDKQRLETETATVEMAEYLLRLVQEKRQAPQDDWISDLVRASATTRASDEDIVRVIGALVSVGNGTPSAACARSLRALLMHPSQFAMLRNDRSLLEHAVDEFMRYDSSLSLFPRYVRKDFELHGRSFKKGQLVALSLIGADHDPRVFADAPDELNLCRDTTEAVSFGHGPHYCPGANIARVELRVMLAAALDFLPAHARLVEEQIRWSSRGIVSQLKNLPVDFGS